MPEPVLLLEPGCALGVCGDVSPFDDPDPLRVFPIFAGRFAIMPWIFLSWDTEATGAEGSRP